MDIFKDVTKLTNCNAHGEVSFFRVDEGNLPDDGWEEFSDTNSTGDFIVGHSENGSHHLLERDGVTGYRRTEKGMQILKIIVEKPVALTQAASSPHEKQTVFPGTYVVTTSREKTFFKDQVHRVVD